METSRAARRDQWSVDHLIAEYSRRSYGIQPNIDGKCYFEQGRAIALSQGVNEKTKFKSPVCTMLKYIETAKLDHSEDNVKFSSSGQYPRLEGKCQAVIMHMGISINHLNHSFVLSRGRTMVNIGLYQTVGHLLAKLHQSLHECLFYSLSTVEKDHRPSSTGTLVATDNGNGSLEQQYDSLLADELCNVCTESKKSSLKIQNYLSNCTTRQAANIGCRLIGRITTLIKHPFGNYVVQRLACKDKVFETKVIEYIVTQLHALSNNQYSSRVLEVLILENPGLRKTVRFVLFEQLCEFLESSPAIRVVQACLQKQSEISQNSFLYDWLQFRPSLKLNKAFQKLMLTHTQHCHNTELDRIYYSLNLNDDILAALDSKIFAFVLATMIMRNHEITRIAVARAIQSNLTLFLTKKNTKTFFLRLWKDPVCHPTKEIGETLAKLRYQDIRSLLTSVSVAQFYFYVTIKTLLLAESTKLSAFMLRPSLAMIIGMISR